MSRILPPVGFVLGTSWSEVWSTNHSHPLPIPSPPSHPHPGSFFETGMTALYGYINPCPAEQIKMPRLLLIFSQSDYLIQIVAINSHT